MDTETGGLPMVLKKQATIEVALTEVAMVVIDNETFSINQKESWLIEPYAYDLIYDPMAAKVSGISKQLCEKEGINIKECYEGMKKVFDKSKKGKCKPIVIFHNKDFDTPFIENVFKMFDDDLYKYIDRIEDTMEWARLKYVEKPKFTLASCAEHCGLDHLQAHRALPDAIITAEVWITFIKSLRGSGESEKKEVKFRHNFKF